MWLTPHGLQGDRGLALIEQEDGKVVSANSPCKWPLMFNSRAAYVELT